MKFLIIGDLHYGKEFSTYQRNRHLEPSSYQQKPWFVKTDEHLRENIKHVAEHIKKSGDIIKVVFVGDVIDAPLLEPNIVIKFKDIVDYCIDEFGDNLNSIDIVVGTHDCLNYGRTGTFLSLLDGYKFMVNVISEPLISELTDDSGILYLPYRDVKHFENLFSDDEVLKLKKFKKLLIFSHNNFCYEYTGNIPLMSIREFNEKMGLNPELEVVFNGHIHNPYRKQKDNIDFIQVGSISPLAFDGHMFRELGMCLYSIEDDVVKYINDGSILDNEKIAFYKIDDDHTIEDLKQKLKEYPNTMFFVKYEASMKDEINTLCEENNNIYYICKYVKEVEQAPESAKEVAVKNEISSEIILGGDRVVDVTEMFNKFLKEKYGFDTTNV